MEVFSFCGAFGGVLIGGALGVGGPERGRMAMIGLGGGLLGAALVLLWRNELEPLSWSSSRHGKAHRCRDFLARLLTIY